MVRDLAAEGPSANARDHRLYRRSQPAAAERLATILESVVERLPDAPYVLRPGRVPGTREAVVHPNYIIVYRVAEVIEMIAVLHARQRYL